ncbi:NmrA family NAD(P)-binding protein [Glycomyces sp. L485]|uniref:NmrA family NAD(P)-binding protein n=1 Tax=Glycomyces sp. L485 TaxID=2909235 RepID=UPI001F4B5D78|nr:NmrA family NAD(P)-binding protein [Glycomyces sp. L485]MCH7232235.1 NmrA family NAD(P)-binding protein [Glycomyces sp. L485]
MDTKIDQKIIALAGGTGRLGSLIAEAVLAQPDTQLRLLVRPASRSKIAHLEAKGAQVVEGELGANAAESAAGALAAFTAGATTVVSAVQGGPDVIIDGQTALLRAARDAGVRRFIPSDYTLDLFKLPPGQILPSDWRRQFAETADAERGEAEVVSVLSGGFLDRGVLFDWLRLIDPDTQTAYLWGDGEATVEYTTYADTARYTAAAALDDTPIGRVLPVAGDRLDFHGLVAAFEKASGKRLRVEQLGSLTDLDDRIAELMARDPQNVFGYFPLMYNRGLLKGEATLPPLRNDRYPWIQPTTVEQYFGAEKL